MYGGADDEGGVEAFFVQVVFDKKEFFGGVEDNTARYVDDFVCGDAVADEVGAFTETFGWFEGWIDDFSAGVEEDTAFGVALLIKFDCLFDTFSVTASQRDDDVRFVWFLGGIRKDAKPRNKNDSSD